MIVLSPWWAALLLPAAVTIWWVYRSGDVTRERILGSTMLLERAKLVSRSIKWRPPWRALIESLLLLAIIVALVRAAIPNESHTFVIAIDNGPRMAATVDERGNQTRLALARDQALNSINLLPSGAQISVITLNSQTELGSKEQARAAVERVSLYYPGGEILENAARARMMFGAKAATVISEGEFSLPKPDWINWISVSEQALNNLALTDFDSATRVLTITSYSDVELSFILSVRSDNGSEIALRKGAVMPSAVRRVSLADVQPFPRGGSINLKASGDGLIIDNTIYFSNEADQGGIYVDSPLTLDQLGLSGISKFKFIGSPLASQTSASALLIHRRELTDSEITTNCVGRRLVVMPSGGTSPQKITWWAENEDLLRYVNLSLLRIPAATLLPTEGAVSLINSQEGSLMTRRSQAECEVVKVGFELFPFTTAGNTTLSILTLDLLSWLTHSDSSNNTLWRAPVDSLVTRVFPSSDRSYHSGDLIDEPGLYRVQSVQNGPEKTSLRASSFISAVTSDLRKITLHRSPSETFAPNGKLTTQMTTQKSSVSITIWALWAAGLLLGIDAIWFISRLSKRRR